MKKTHKDSNEKARKCLNGKPIIWALYFLSFFILVRFCIQPELIHHAIGRYELYKIYKPGINYFTENILPGVQILPYINGFILHCYRLPFLGALIFTLIAGLQSLGVIELAKIFRKERFTWVGFIPPLLMIARCSRYYHPTLTLNLALILMFGLLVLHKACGAKNILRLTSFACFAITLYVLAPEVFLAFVLLAILIGINGSLKQQLVAGYFLSAIIIPITTALILPNSGFAFAFKRLLAFYPCTPSLSINIQAALEIMVYPAIGLLCILWPNSKKTQHNNQKIRTLVIYAFVSFLLALLLSTITCNRTLKRQLRIESFGQQHMWKRVIQEANRLPHNAFDLHLVNWVNRALFHTGRLPYDMFIYPQSVKGLILNPSNSKNASERYRSYVQMTGVFCELGYLNEAERMAHEALETAYYAPETMKMLARINLAKNQTETAKRFLHALAKDFFYRDWAIKQLKLIETPSMLEKDADIARMKSLMITNDCVIENTTPDGLFLPLLEANIRNKMAFEYIMASYLLSGESKLVAHNTRFISSYNYPNKEIPTLYAQAILVHTLMTQEVIDLYGWKISNKVTGRFSNFMSRISARKDNLNEVKETLLPDFGDTYYYHSLFNTKQQRKQ